MNSNNKSKTKCKLFVLLCPSIVILKYGCPNILLEIGLDHAELYLWYYATLCLQRMTYNFNFVLSTDL